MGVVSGCGGCGSGEWEWCVDVCVVCGGVVCGCLCGAWVGVKCTTVDTIVLL